MQEIPEGQIISFQAGATLTGKRITQVFNSSSPHKFTFYNDDPLLYPKLLTGKRILSSKAHGMFVDIHCEDHTSITTSDGTNMRYLPPGGQPPAKYQLLIRFDDDSSLVFTVAMYGGIWVFRESMENKYYQGSLNCISPLEDGFDEVYFEKILKSTAKDLSVKALLATEQRIPGLGNGVLQDILFNASLNPKRKRSTLDDFQLNELFHSLKVTLNAMTDKGGRDTEKDLFGQAGGYRTILSKNTLKEPCPNCGQTIIKQAYLGGAVYFCPDCQVL